MSREELHTRDRILEATCELMESHRGTGVSMSAIARQAGISRQAVYLHFASRGELLIEAVQHRDQRLGIDERLAATNQASSGVARLEAFVEFWGRYIPKIHGIAKALMTSKDTDEAAAAAWNDRMQAVRRGCRAAVEALQRDGDLARPWSVSEATDLLWAMLSFGRWEQLTLERGWSNKKYIEATQEIARRAFVEVEKRKRGNR